MAWIITQGTNIDITRYFSEKNVCIGIAPWGNIYNRKELQNMGDTVIYESYSKVLKRKKEIQGENLDKNHTHFFLVDDGSVNKTGGELEFRAKFEKELCGLHEKWQGEFNFVYPVDLFHHFNFFVQVCVDTVSSNQEVSKHPISEGIQVIN